MNAELITELKARYRTFLLTAEGREQLTQAIRMKKMWQEELANSDICIKTEGINPNKISKELNKRITKLAITPIGLNNMCHLTTQFFCKQNLGITSRIGYNITACPCGNFMSYELHSVNKYNGQLYDFTRDFNDETEKYFLEIDTDIPADAFISMFGRAPITIDKGCRCCVGWTNMKEYLKTEKALLQHIQRIECMRMLIM